MNVISSLTIKDAVRFEDYRRMLLPKMAKYGARLVARGGPIVLEGEWPRERLIIAEFPQHGAGARVVGFARIRRAKGAAPSHG